MIGVLVGHAEHRQRADDSQSTLGSLGITGRQFPEYQLRDEQGEVVATLPPALRQALVCRPNEIAARTCCQVADDAGFDVD
jgi:hypothetical protein